MFSATSRGESPTCPKCQEVAGLALHARLPEADGFPEIECFECRTCGEVVLVERGLGEGRPRVLAPPPITTPRRDRQSSPPAQPRAA